MEVEAHTHAIQWVASQLDEQITHAIILTDPVNLLQKVESGMGCPDWHTAMHSLRLQTFLWIYCPRHVGVSGNKQADRLTTYAHRSRWSIGHQRPLAITLSSGLLWPFQTSSGVALTFEKLRIANAQHGKNYVSSPAAKATISTDLPKIDKHENTNV